MQTLKTIDKFGQKHHFNYSVIANKIEGANAWEYHVFKEHEYEHFYINLLQISPQRILILYMGNNDHAAVSGKRIMDFMIPLLSERHQASIVSSSNLEAIKTSNWEGREEGATIIWKRLNKQFDNVRYLEEEDRYVFEHLPSVS